METLAVYLFKVNLVISVFYLVYILCLEKEKFFTVNRFLLIAVLVVSFILPFLPDLHSFSLNNMERFQDRIYSVNPFSGLYTQPHAPEKASLPGQILTTTRETTPGFFSGISLFRLFVILNMMVTLVLLLRFANQLSRLFRLILGSRKRWPDGILCYEHEKEISPFSFFHCLVINPALYSDEQYAQIVLHEKEHIRGWHSIDILLTEKHPPAICINMHLYFRHFSSAILLFIR
ncbi:MAG: hypothetical protein Q8918_17060 [Bacteroidota bacterium]|nr:hypothetical protein [Bacteroidota bacterium]MDP4251812.1 hypothetical protein [Bacteroidota bacterium]